MKSAHIWGDTALLHGLGCVFNVDVVVLMDSGVALVGYSLMPDATHDVELPGWYV